MKTIQKTRLAVQVLFAGLTATAIIMNFPALKTVILLTTLLGGVFYCGWACPLGFIQDIGSKLGIKLGIKRRQLPDSIHKVAIYMRYILALSMLVIITDLMMNLMQYEPRGAFLGLISGRIPSTAALIVIAFFIVLSVRYDRVYCRYICPEGAKYGLISLFRPFTFKRNVDKCVNCGKCDKACPMQIKVSDSEKLRSPQCINCFQCVSSCPIDSALEYGFVLTKNNDEKSA